MTLKTYNDSTGGLNANKTNAISDKDLVICKNMFYNAAGQLQTRRGYRTFANQIGSSPITSFFSFTRTDNGQQVAVCNSGDKLYSLDETTLVRNQILDWLLEYERSSVPMGQINKRVRKDAVVYLNQLYITDGVNPYMSTNGSTVIIDWLWTATAYTVDPVTNVFTKVAHGLSIGNEIRVSTTGTMPWGLQANRFYYILTVPTPDTFTVSELYNGTVVDITTAGTGTQNYQTLAGTQPRIRYMQISQNVARWAGEDKNPNTLYFTDWFSLPVPNLQDITANQSGVGAEQEWIINWMGQYAQGLMVMKSKRTYYASVASGAFLSDPIDSQAGGYSNRAIDIVADTIVYFNESGVDSLAKRDGVNGAGAIVSQNLSSKIRDLLNTIQPISYNSNCAQYVKKANNYHFAIDTNWDDIPDTVVVYSSITGGRSIYDFGNVYHFGEYTAPDWNSQFLFASGSGGQMYEYEYGFTDDWNPIQCEIQTKAFDEWQPSQVRNYSYVDVIGYKQRGGIINISVLVNGVSVSGGEVTDDNLDFNLPPLGIGVRPIGTGTIWGEWAVLDLYPFTVRVPLYEYGNTIALNLQSEVQMIYEKMRVNIDNEEVDYFAYANIL